MWPPDAPGYGIRMTLVCFVFPPLIWGIVLTPFALAIQVLMWDYVEYKLAQFKYDIENHNGPTAS